VALQMQAEAMQQQILQGEPVDPDHLIRIKRETRRIMAMLKLKGSENASDGWSPLRERLMREASE
jgi:hypothetical protein